MGFHEIWYERNIIERSSSSSSSKITSMADRKLLEKEWR